MAKPRAGRKPNPGENHFERQCQANRRTGKGNMGKKRVVVHLGNVEGKPSAEKSKRYAKKFPRVIFIGIDLMPLHGKKPENLRQIKSDFVSGLVSVYVLKPVSGVVNLS